MKNFFDNNISIYTQERKKNNWQKNEEFFLENKIEKYMENRTKLFQSIQNVYNQKFKQKKNLKLKVKTPRIKNNNKKI